MSAPSTQELPDGDDPTAAWWDAEGGAEAFRRIRAAVGDPPANAKHVAEYACEVLGSMLRAREAQAKERRVPITVYYRRGERFVVGRAWIDADPAGFLEASGPCVLVHSLHGWRPFAADLHLLLEWIENRDLPGPSDWMDGEAMDDGGPNNG